MDVKRAIVEAWEAVESAGLPEHVQPVAFEQALRLLTNPGLPSRGAAPTPEREGSGQPSTDARSSAPAPAPLDDDEFFRRFADESGIKEELLRSVYYLKDGSVRLSLSRRTLGGSVAEKNRAVAMLALGARHYTEGKASITIGEVREAIKPHGYDPTRNLGKQLEAIPGTQAVGAGNDKAVRVQGARFDAPFSALIERLSSKE